jgi:putative nucleotidyltransferase with HDIG domain
MDTSKPRHSKGTSLFYALLVVVTAVLAWVALMIPLRQQLQLPALEAGQVARQDYQAPQTISYTSQVLTEQKQEEAEHSILPVYSPPDTNIARQQLERLRMGLAYINSVRADTYANPEQKLVDLAALDYVQLDLETRRNILQEPEMRWQAIAQEAAVVLEKVMSSTIRPESLSDARNRALSLVSLSLTEKEAALAAELAAALVAPNSIYSEELTQAARQAAREAVAPVSRAFIAGQTVVRQGQVLNTADVETLQQMGLIQPPLQWQEPVSAAVLVLLMMIFILLYFRRNRTLLAKPRRLLLVDGLFLVFLFTARLAIPEHIVIPYAFPLVAFGLTVVALFGMQLAMVGSVPLAILTAYSLPNSLDLTLYYLVGSLVGVLALGGARRVSSFFWAGLAVAVAGAMVVLAYRLPLPSTDWIGIATLAGVSLFNGLATASLTILLQYFLAQLLGMTTHIQLQDLSRPDHPLLQAILRSAPGTYQHSLQVANLAEQAAERVEADALLTRVGALYHDAGKTLNPAYFIENLAPGASNPHDSLDPYTSALEIIRHVSDGLELGRKYRLPRRIQEFISEHHGTTITRYQYVRAVQAVGGDENRVDKTVFRYPGPRPQSRETAILMLADGSEARVRAERPKDEDTLRSLIKQMFEERMAAGQLDDTQLTLLDLNEIIDSFAATLRGIYHPRLLYPSLEKPATLDVSTRPTPQVVEEANAEALPDGVDEPTVVQTPPKN